MLLACYRAIASRGKKIAEMPHDIIERQRWLSVWLFCRKLRHVHVKNFPGVPVKIFDGSQLHKAVILHFAGFRSACGQSGADDLVYLVNAVNR